MHLLAAGPARGVLAAGGVQVEPSGEHDGRQDLLLLEPQAVRVERGRLLHRDQRHQLEQVVLDHVAGGADAVVVAGPAADADVLGHRDLHVVDVVGVPDRLEHRVGEPHRQDVLDRLLAEVVVDAEHRLRREHLGDDRVELAARSRGREPNGFSTTTRRQRARVWLGEAVLLELADHVGEEPRRDRQVERVVAAGAADPVELVRWSAAGCRTRRRRRSRPARTGSPRRAAARPPRGTRCGRAPSPSRARSGRSPGRPSPAGRSRPARSPAAAARGWPGRRSPASASCGTGRR